MGTGHELSLFGTPFRLSCLVTLPAFWIWASKQTSLWKFGLGSFYVIKSSESPNFIFLCIHLLQILFWKIPTACRTSHFGKDVSIISVLTYDLNVTFVFILFCVYVGVAPERTNHSPVCSTTYNKKPVPDSMSLQYNHWNSFLCRYMLMSGCVEEIHVNK